MSLSEQRRRSRLFAACLLFGLLSACGASSDEPAGDTVADATAAETATEPAAEAATEPAAEPVDEAPAVDDCDFSEFVYTEFTEIPADWPATFPVPEGLVEVSGDVGFGCDRQTVDSRARYYGNDGRDWITAYGDQLVAAGFELSDDADDYDELLSWNRTFRRGDDWISYGGNFELVGGDREYVSLGFSLTDFPE